MVRPVLLAAPAALLTLTATAPAVAAPAPQPAADALTVTVPAASGAPGYTIDITKSPFQITTERAGGTVLQTTASGTAGSGPADFNVGSTKATATSVQSSAWQDGALDLTLATTLPGVTVDYRIAPSRTGIASPGRSRAPPRHRSRAITCSPRAGTGTARARRRRRTVARTPASRGRSTRAPCTTVP